MATITKSIGTATRDYSTISSWESDLDNGAVYSAADDAVGEGYNDSTFDEDVIINGGGTIGLTSITLSVVAADRHDGTEGSGARIVRTGVTNNNILEVATTTAVPVTVQWWEIDGANQGAIIGAYHSGADAAIFRRNIIHDITYEGAADVRGMYDDGAGDTYFIRNIVYNIHRAATTRNVYGIYDGSGGTRTTVIDNNTVHNCTHGSTSARNIRFLNDTANKFARNNVGTTADTCFDGAFTTGTYSNNASSDATAPGTGSQTNITVANQYTNITAGSEDLHLKSGADCIDNGTNLGSTNEVNVDIDGTTVTGTWDIGADEYVAAGGANYLTSKLGLMGVGI